MTRGDEHHGVAHANDNGAIGLFGQTTRLDGESLGAESEISLVHMTCDLLGSDALLADTEALDHLSVTVDVLALQIVQQSPALADKLEQSAARMMVLRVRLEMLVQIIDAF